MHKGLEKLIELYEEQHSVPPTKQKVFIMEQNLIGFFDTLIKIKHEINNNKK